MLFSIKWLEELLKIRLDMKNLEKIHLDLGLEIEEVFNLAPESIVIGRIKRAAPHPSLKNLTVLDIHTNKDMQIVTAAENVKAGDFVLIGPAGTQLNQETIKEMDFGGVKSQGILISEEELGLAEKSAGVITLEKGKVGIRFKDYFDDIVVEITTTPNRPDWLSVEGIARELSVSMDVNYSKIEDLDRILTRRQHNRSGSFRIIIKDTQGCPRYTARIFDNVSVKESPFWIKWRLHCMGMNSKNNVVDITNLIMLLTGQPQHPFDLDLLKGGIIIRKAHDDENFITLEGTIVKLDKTDLIIADHEGPIALAGIIGAKRAQISSATRRVLLESAYFSPKRIGHTARRLGLMTDASIRFERGADISIADATSAMTSGWFKKYTACRELEFIGLGKKAQPKSVKFSLARLNDTLSINLKKNQLKKMLNKLNINVTGKKVLVAKIPHGRRDVNIEEDIYEEVARIYGYMNIPETQSEKWAGSAKINKELQYEEQIKNYLVGQGFNETYNLSLISSKRLDDFGFSEYAKIKNPLNERFNALRPTLFFGLCDCVNYNISKGNRSLKLFESGNILFPKTPFQEKRLGVIMGGERYADFWNQENEKIDYYDAKGLVESIFSVFHINDISFNPIEKKGFEQAVTIIVVGKELGFLGSIDNNLCKEEDYYYFELALDPLRTKAGEPFYIPPAKYPANIRDLSFIVDEDVEVPAMTNMIVKVGGPVLDKVSLFDYYTGKNLPANKKSLGFRFYFRAPDRTLTDKEVDSFIRKITDEVVKTFKANLRTKEQSWKN